ncbi:RusA family crossover junction endodeoxyribonuclease [Nitrosomonas communis]|uniref:RusA family crossover junction endodeoxyribonuclease n=1 Tax=Nitrosomonas communis TaxID=44574 RepID=UPI003D2D6DF9
MQISFLVPGNPVAKGRPKTRIRKQAGGKSYAQVYTPEATANYENLVKVKAEEAMRGCGLIEDAVSVDIQLFVMVPASWSQKKQREALGHRVLPTSKPDTDNCIKTLFDAMNEVVWRDDKQVVNISLAKRYSANPCALVTVSTNIPDLSVNDRLRWPDELEMHVCR